MTPLLAVEVRGPLIIGVPLMAFVLWSFVTDSRCYRDWKRGR